MDEQLYNWLVNWHQDEIGEVNRETEFEYEMLEEGIMNYNNENGTSYNPANLIDKFLEQFNDEFPS